MKDTLAAGPAHALADALDHPGSARLIGRKVLAAAPGLSPDRLVAALAGAAGLAAERLPTIDRALLRSRLRAARAGEFHRGETVRVEGWVLSATEARLCALVALL
jgi:hypothetical protein